MTTIDQKIQEAYSSAQDYPHLVRLLIEAGVQSYTVDVASDTKLYFLSNYERLLHRGDATPRAIALQMNIDQLQAALRASQAGEITYPQFMSQIAAAGVLFYHAVLLGAQPRVQYVGTGADYEELIPIIS